MDILVSVNGRNYKIVSLYVSFRVKRRHRIGAADSIRFNLNNTNLWKRNKWGVGPNYRRWIKCTSLSTWTRTGS